ncbi:MAG: hypothetical protein OJJ21_08595 [Ferrovibrio sp.]|uniref:DUF6624 domain-containing protein n=1 Tax=Ferrovibrio sp. TaxID=1917215 RepID=UPI002613F0F1|nr:DUF6624 domain-containing protein [Ferrovibrio sp.]MCW0233641.1 hypothetical protein [Ferrovibrio sp.]
MDQSLRQRLIGMVEDSRRLRAVLAADGSLFQGYNEQLRNLHNSHAKALADIVDAQGWPGKSKAGEDGAAAAWMIVQQAIGLPRFMRACLEVLEAAAAKGDVPRWQVALLTDRICWLEGRPQVYGTQFDWDDKGELSPVPIADEATVEARRALCDLIPLAEGIRQRRAEAQQNGETPPPPAEAASRRRDFDDWAKAIGWRS